MLRNRFFAVAAATVSIASVVASGSAAAQTASTDQGSTPLSLMHLFSQPAAAAAPAADPAPAPTAAKPRKVTSRRHHATTARNSEQHGAHAAASSTDPAQSNASADAWLAASAPPADAIPAAASGTAPQDASPPSAVVIGGETVQIAEANQVNEIDLAAGNAPPPAAPANPAPPDMALPDTDAMQSDMPPSDRADAFGAAGTKAAQADNSQVSQVAFVAPAAAAQNADSATTGPADLSAQDSGAQNSSTIGGAAWIAQLLAALGGAVAAGIVAWFLIGAEPVRSYG